MEARWERSPDPLDRTTSRDSDEVSQPVLPRLAYTYRRDPPPRTVMTSLSISASKLRLLRLIMAPLRPPQPASASGSGALPATGDSRALHELQGQPHEAEAAESVASGDVAVCAGVHGWEDMGTVKRVSVFQAPVPPSSSDDRRRPIMVIADSIRLIITETTRYRAVAVMLGSCRSPDAGAASARSCSVCCGSFVLDL